MVHTNGNGIFLFINNIKIIILFDIIFITLCIIFICIQKKLIIIFLGFINRMLEK